MANFILLKCPCCQRGIEVEDQYLGMSVECPFCRNEFVVKPDNPPGNDEPAENSAATSTIEDVSGNSSRLGKKKWILSLIILLLAAGIGVLLYILFFIPYLKNKQIQQFKDNFAEQYRDSLRDPNFLLIDWKTACMSDDGSKFWSIAIIRAKNAMGGYADPIAMKIYGKTISNSDNSTYTFYKIPVGYHPLMHRKNIDFDSFQKHERGKLQELIREMDRKIQQATADAKKALALIVMPVVKPGRRVDFEFERTQLRKRVADIYESQLKILEFYNKDPDHLFYLYAMPGEMPDIKKKLDELDKLGEEAKKRQEAVFVQLQDFERQEAARRKEEERKQELRRKEEERKQELRRQKDRQIQQKNERLASYEYEKKKMLDSAVSFYRKNHHWQRPDAPSVFNYRNKLDVLLPQIRKHYKKILFLNQKVAELPQQLSESEKIRAVALRQLLADENRKVNEQLSQLLSGIHCVDSQCPCRKKQLPSSFITIDLQSDSYDDVMFGQSNKNETSKAESQTYGSGNRQILRRRGRTVFRSR